MHVRAIYTYGCVYVCVLTMHACMDARMHTMYA